MMNYFKIAIGISLALAASRFVPHPPNFTSLITLSFYIPAFFGLKFIPVVILALLGTDFIIGLHSLIFFTSGSVLLIGLMSKLFNARPIARLSGSLLGCILFYLLTNLGVWFGGSYGYSLSGFINCYVMAIPFFFNTLTSTLIFSIAIELTTALIFDEKSKIFLKK